MPKADRAPANVTRAAERAAEASTQRGELQLFGSGCGWLQSDPQSGQTHLWNLRDQCSRRLTPDGFSVRSRVYEYGGGAWAADTTGAWFVNDSDQGIYLQPWDGGPPQLWWRQSQRRYGDLTLDPVHRRLLTVEECQQAETLQHRLVAIDLVCSRRQVLAEGADFYAAPALSPDGRQLCWLSWDHPWQPWLATRLHRARLDDEGWPQCTETLLDGCRPDTPESVLQPRFGPDSCLWLISDRSGWWNLYRWLPHGPQAAFAIKAECAGAPWQLGACSYRPLADGGAFCTALDRGRARLWRVRRDSTATPLPGDWGEVSALAVAGDQRALLAADCHRVGQLWCGTFDGSGLQPALTGWGSDGEPPLPFLFKGEDGEPLHGFYYPAAEPDAPLLVQLHGGPTAYRAATYDSQRQFWLDQGYGVIELNYRGSSGYGRAYRHQLAGQWGERDAADACAAGRYAISQGWVSPGRLAVRGNSSGGYTVLRALQQPDQPFSAGGCHYGISDLGRLAAHTHKFEARYLDWLVGDPATKAVRYRQRSPLLNGLPLLAPVIFFQGAEDRVVPKEQTHSLFEALRHSGVDCEYLEFDGEGHGFRRAANRARVLEREWLFYQRTLNGVAASP